MSDNQTSEVIAKGLRTIQIRPAGYEDTVAIMLQDVEGETNGYLINPDGLRVVLQPLLSLAGQWSDKPALDAGNLGGEQHALPAQRVEFLRGRTSTEAAVRVSLGRLELNFLVPLDAAVGAAQDLLGQLKTPGTPPGEG
jgi:hypothetical protein